jgi:hypothetical protein
LKIDQFFDEMIQDRLKQKGLNVSKDFLNAMLSLPKTHGFGDKLGDNTIKAIINVSYHALAMYFMISSKELNVVQ